MNKSQLTAMIEALLDHSTRQLDELKNYESPHFQQAWVTCMVASKVCSALAGALIAARRVTPGPEAEIFEKELPDVQTED
jgi:hypothetical protein